MHPMALQSILWVVWLAAREFTAESVLLPLAAALLLIYAYIW